MKFYSIIKLFCILILFHIQNSFKILDLEVNTSEERIDKILNIYFKKKDKINLRISKDLFLKFLTDKNTKEIFLLKSKKKEHKNLEKYLIIEQIILEYLSISRIRILRKKKAEKILKSDELFEKLTEIIKRRNKFKRIKVENIEKKKMEEEKKKFKTNDL